MEEILNHNRELLKKLIPRHDEPITGKYVIDPNDKIFDKKLNDNGKENDTRGEE